MQINRWAVWGSLLLVALVALANLTGPAAWASHLEQPWLQTTPCVPGTVPCRTPRPPTQPPATQPPPPPPPTDTREPKPPKATKTSVPVTPPTGSTVTPVPPTRTATVTALAVTLTILAPETFKLHVGQRYSHNRRA